jgi:hypothetical protein
MGDITLSIPDELLVALKVPPEQCGRELRLAADYGVDTFRLSAGDMAQETPLV